MWRIDALDAETNQWLPIWMGAGLDAERDAQTRFAQLCERVDRAQPDSDDALPSRCLAVRLSGPNGERIEHTRTRNSISTRPPAT